ncbi:MAG: hypothetical protein FWD18_07265 [Micrococcales bacterium]|nr:hypothetical protein [Micrococcales bacterium]
MIEIDHDEMRRVSQRLEDAAQQVPSLASRTPTGVTYGSPMLDATVARFVSVVDTSTKKTGDEIARLATGVEKTSEDFPRLREHVLAVIAGLRRLVQVLR